MDPRLKDAVRNVPNQIVAISHQLKQLQEDIDTLTTLVRAIKKSVVRKYGETEENGS